MNRTESSLRIFSDFTSIDDRRIQRPVAIGGGRWGDYSGVPLNGIHYVKQDNFIYEGEFKDGQPHGSGEMRTDGNTYKGEFNQGMMEGLGRIVYENGLIHEGYFRGNVLNGKGKIIDYHSQVEFTGFFVDGLLEDLRGEKKDRKYSIRIVGKFSFGLAQGAMKVYDLAGAIHDLVFRDGKCIDPKFRKDEFGVICITGEGEDCLLDSTTLGLPTRRGTVIHSSGVTCRGEVENGRVNGRGAMFCPGSGMFYRGHFLEGIMFDTVEILSVRTLSEIYPSSYIGPPSVRVQIP